MTKSTGQRKWHIKNIRPRDPALKPIGAWLSVNRNCYADFRQWLKEASYSDSAMNQYCVGARLVFGLINKEYWIIDSETDLPQVRAFIANYPVTHSTREAYLKGVAKLDEFSRARNHRLPGPREINWAHYLEGIPTWLGDALKAYLAHQRRAWRQEDVHRYSIEFLSDHTRALRWMATHATLNSFIDITPAVWFAYVDARLTENIQAATLNHQLTDLQGFVRFFAEEGQPVCARLLEVKQLKTETRLPRDISIDKLQALMQEIDKDRASAHAGIRRMGIMDRAWFLLMLHSGLRTIEVRRLVLTGLDLEHRKIRVEQSKGMKDRIVYLSMPTIQALAEYLKVRGPAGTEMEYVFLLRHQRLSRRYIAQRLCTYHRRCGVKATPHQLRHSCATLLLNAGAPALTVQTILGHKHIDTTLGYARLYDGTIAADYYRAMAEVESRFAAQNDAPMVAPSTSELLALVDALKNGTLSESQRETLGTLRAGLLKQAQQASIKNDA